MLTQERLKKLFHYDLDTGIFTRKISTSSRGRKGNIPGTKTKEGYIRISIDHKSYMAHRLAWLYVYGEWPKDQIDHIDRVRSNNSIKNLRDVNNLVNSHNFDIKNTHSNSGYRGVHLNKKLKLYEAKISVNKISTHLGLYKNPITAHIEYLKAIKKYHSSP